MNGNGIAARLRSRRAYHGWTRDQLADRAGVDAGTIGNLERGETKNPKVSTVRRLADALDVKMSTLMGED